MSRHNDESRSRRWLAVLAAACLILQAAVSGLTLGACASPSFADKPTAVSHAFGQSEEGPGGHHHRGAPDCCFIAGHLLIGKISPPSDEFVLGSAETDIAGLSWPERSRLGDSGHERLPQNPRAPPLPV